jgi:TPR repeat protein
MPTSRSRIVNGDKGRKCCLILSCSFFALPTYSGACTKRDYKQARFWYEKAATAGYSIAMNNLAAIYLHGRGVKSDCKQAHYWNAKAASAGNAEAMFILGNHYQNGTGVEQDDAQARLWYEKAADADNLAALACPADW